MGNVKSPSFIVLHSLSVLLVPVLRVVLDAVHVLVALLAAGHGTRKRLLVRPVGPGAARVPAAVAHDELGAELLRRPRVVAVLRLRQHHLLLVHLAARRRVAAIGRRDAVAVVLDRQLALQLGRRGGAHAPVGP